MCGISGIYTFSKAGEKSLSLAGDAASALRRRGPDHRDTWSQGAVALAHSRLSIIDLSADGNQPFISPDGHHILVFNGEFYNYREHRKQLESNGVSFKSSSDTEVLLHLLIREGIDCLKKVNGFFAFAYYNVNTGEMIIARDRFGIKPLYVFRDHDRLIFGSELKAIKAWGIPGEIDPVALHTYLQLNYIPAPQSIYKNVVKVMPGNYWKISANGQIDRQEYYNPGQESKPAGNVSYGDAQKHLSGLIENAVAKRLIADVPVGSFLSGGIDSSVIVAVASRLTSNLNTFSMGYSDEAFYDETGYAEKVAEKFKTNHTSYKITKSDLLEELFEVLNYLDEPFADSSALAVSILSKKTRQKAKVALSGDGADEIFSGYNKHKAALFAAGNSFSAKLLSYSHPLWKALPKSRDSKNANLFRQLEKLSKGLQLSPRDRYWYWATFQQESWVNKLMISPPAAPEIEESRQHLLRAFSTPGKEMDQVLNSDISMVLPDDMLTKVDRMSMMHGLEVRVPFLDHSVVEYVKSLPLQYKIDRQQTKKILRDTYRELLPADIYTRPKHGFEVPLASWCKKELRQLIENELLSNDFIRAQGLFNIEVVEQLRKKLFSSSPGDAAMAVWTLLSFNYWWKNNKSL